MTRGDVTSSFQTDGVWDLNSVHSSDCDNKVTKVIQFSVNYKSENADRDFVFFSPFFIQKMGMHRDNSV